MSSHAVERVTRVHHWNDNLFSFRTTRDESLRFESGQFVMVGLEVEGRPLMRAYSIASASWEEHLEFFSIKVQHGALTSRLQHVREGDPVLISRKPTGTLVLRDLRPGRHLYLLSTGTGLAPFLSLVQEPETYERYDAIVLAHGVREIQDLAYAGFIEEELPRHEYFGDAVRAKLRYYPSVTREAFRNRGRLTDLLASDRLAEAVGLPPIDSRQDRFMLCGGPAMLAESRALLDQRGFEIAPRIGHPGDYVIERAFTEK
jgi:ferredoxin--NADP+ reductase